MRRKIGFRKKAGKFFAVMASAAMVVTSIPMNYGYAKADSVQIVSEDDDSETQTVEKNASDVAVLKKIIAEQKERGANVSEDLDDPDYGWEEIDGELRLTKIDWNYKKLYGEISFAGLDEITELYLSCSSDAERGEVTGLNVSENPKLEILKCCNNQLTKLDLTHNENLNQLECFDNFLSELNLNNNKELNAVYCSSNQLKKLEVSNSIYLLTLYCDDNHLTELDVSKNTELDRLYCDNNQLTQLDISKNGLKELGCSNNQLTGLNVSENEGLVELYCYNNQLTELDISKNTRLETLCCSNNQLSELNVSYNIKLRRLICNDNNISTINISNCSKIVDYENGSYYLRCDDNVQIIRDSKSDFIENSDGKNTSDVVLIKKLIEEQVKRDTNVSNNLNSKQYEWTEIDGEMRLTSVDWFCVEVQGEISFAGLSELRYLRCSSNQLTKLDISKNTKLETLDCNNNQLNELDVSNNIELKNLDCSTNKLTELDISNNTELKYLSCNNNQLDKLYVSNNTELEKLYCSTNKLTELNITYNTVLKYLYCFNNEIIVLDISKCKYLIGYKSGSLYLLYDDKVRLIDNTASTAPTETPMTEPTTSPTENPTAIPTVTSSIPPKEVPTTNPTVTPMQVPTESSSITPMASPSIAPTVTPSTTPTEEPKATSTVKPTEVPIVTPTASPAKKAKSTINAKNTYKKYLGDNKFKLNAKTNSDGTVKYKSSNTNVVKVSSKGEITIVGCGEAKVTISVKATDDYKAVSKKVTIKVLPETVQNFKVKALSGGKVKCTWKGKSTKNTNCQIQYSLNKQFKNVKTFASKPSLKSGSYKGKGLKKGKTYYLRIRAIAKSGGKSYTGKWSKTIKVKVK